MKLSLKYLVGSVVIAAMATLTACGGSSGSSDPGPVVGVAGGVNPTPGNVGQGTWSGVVQGNGSQQFLAMMAQTGSYQANLDLQLTTYNGGQMPGQIGVTMGYSMQFYANASVSGNAFSAIYTPGYGGGAYGGTGYPYQQQCVPGYPCQTPVAQTGVPLIQFNTQFVDPCTKQIMTVQVFYQGSLVAQGTLNSNTPIQTYVYNPACPNQQVYSQQYPTTGYPTGYATPYTQQYYQQYPYSYYKTR